MNDIDLKRLELELMLSIISGIPIFQCQSRSLWEQNSNVGQKTCIGAHSWLGPARPIFQMCATLEGYAVDVPK